jgi:hypothetical protein
VLLLEHVKGPLKVIKRQPQLRLLVVVVLLLLVVLALRAGQGRRRDGAVTQSVTQAGNPSTQDMHLGHRRQTAPAPALTSPAAAASPDPLMRADTWWYRPSAAARKPV